MTDCTQRACTGFAFWDNADHAVDERNSPNLVKLRDQMRLEIQESQRKFAADMEKRLEQALKADRTQAVVNAKKASNGGGNKMELESSFRTAWWQKVGDTEQVEYTQMKKTYTSLPQQGGNRELALQDESQAGTREIGELQQKWIDDWIVMTELGELDIYTCLGLSNCFSWTPDTRKIFLKCVAVTFLQMVVPFCLLMSEFSVGIELGPAEGNLAFRITGFTLYGYAVYNMYAGASDECRTSLMNLAFHYKDMPPGNWLPLVFGEVSNVFTAVVLVIALYSIFTTQTAPADLILNAVAVNFLGDCDGAFVSEDMKDEAVGSFKELTHDLFTDHNNDHVDDPSYSTWPANLSKCALMFVCLAGMAGCICFLIFPTHTGGLRDVEPGFGHHVKWFNESLNETMENSAGAEVDMSR